MGDPKFQRRKFETPKKPWDLIRITEENTLLKKYGLKSKKEIWRSEAMLRKYRRVARLLMGRSDEQALKESKQMLERLERLDILRENATVDDVLNLSVESFLGRRLQSVVYLNGLAKSPKHARQLIVHGHVLVNGRSVRVPSYLVNKDDVISLGVSVDG
ncbi:MAG: 30S ribosomal protein S4 [Candidatus Thermoplasmatota archaeon]|nr:30S ribosomal protein S4 [Candidatus Thermoplasmatota archaeon]